MGGSVDRGREPIGARDQSRWRAMSSATGPGDSASSEYGPSCTTREGKNGVCGNPYAATIFATPATSLTQFTLMLAAFTSS